MHHKKVGEQNKNIKSQEGGIKREQRQKLKVIRQNTI